MYFQKINVRNKSLQWGVVLLLATSIVSSSHAASCSERLKEVIDRRDDAMEGVAAVYLEVGWTVPTVLVGTLTGSGWLAFGAAVGTLVAVELPLIISHSHAVKVHKLLSQARTCDGKILNRAWKKFEKRFEFQTEITKEQFCAAMVAADENGTACNGEKVPERHEVLRITANELEETLAPASQGESKLF